MTLPHPVYAVMAITIGFAGFSVAAGQSIDELTARLELHPSVVALSHQADAAHQRSVAATALPDPVISVGVNNFPVADPSFTEYLPTNKAIGVRQAIPNKASRQAKADASYERAGRAELQRSAQIAALTGQLVALLHEKRRIREERRLIELREKKYQELVSVAETEIDAGRPAVFRLGEIDAERAMVARERVELNRLEADVNAQLIDLVGTIPNTPAPPVEPRPWSGDVMDFHLVRTAAADIRTAQYSVQGAQAAWKPNWGLQLTYQQREAGPTFAGDDWVSGMVTFSAPLWAKQNQAPRLKAAKADRAASEMRYQAIARSVRATYDTQNAIAHAGKENIAVLQRNIDAIRAKMQAKLSSYEAGQGDYSAVIDAEIAILKLQAEMTEEDSRRAGAIARMNALLVTP
ncbi:MAG: TolC family protein [Parvularcula sp.]